jgi:serine/threonine-protein kinase
VAATEPRVLGGRYQVGELLGHGGMAEVHRGRDTRLGRDVAVKLLRSDLARDPTFQARFRREAQAAASLNHPSIVAVYDTGEDAGTPYIVMEYVEGRTLRQVLATEGRLYPHRALEITAEVCKALDSAHRAGIVHRDIKPANVMLTPTGDVKVMDFGIARAVAASSATMTQTAAIIGTAHYLSPEQARGEHVDARSDVYSTGCLLYELLTGAPPFTGDTPVAVAYQHVREDPVPPSRLDPDISPSLDAIVLKAMAKNPANRYQSADEMRADLDRALAGRPVEATPVLADELSTLPPPPPTTVLLRRPEQRHRGRALAYAGLALAALAVFVVALVVFRGLLGNTATEVNTPDVTGRTLNEAIAILQSKGLREGNVTEQYTGKDDTGLIIDQNPQPDIFLNKGDSVDLVVSKGIRYVNVPPLVGLTQADATTALTQAGLKLGGVTRQNNPAPAGQVLSADPTEGTRLPAGSKVTLVVSNGQVQVPDVRGKTVAEARLALQQAGFKVVLDPPASPDNAKVINQNPVGGSYAPNGSTVTLTTNAPSPTPSPSPSPTPSPTPSASASATPLL